MTSQQSQQQSADTPALNPLGLVIAKLAQFGQNASNNIRAGFDNVTTLGWIRLVVIVCTYLLIRPHILKYSTTFAVKKMEEQEVKEKKAREDAAKNSPNDLRGLKSNMEPDEDTDEGADGSGADWGSKARVRQRKMLRILLEAEEQRRLDEEEDADIKENLVD